MGDVKIVNFGTPAARQRAKLADHLERTANYIRTGQMEFEPSGYILLLQSETNPERFEMLHVGISKIADMEQANVVLRKCIVDQYLRNTKKWPKK